jgi:glutathione S-transferase
MILVGQYDSPYVRRTAISLRVLGFGYEHDTRSIFGDFEAMRKVNPLVRIPSLVLDDGEVLIDSAAILDHLDEWVGAERALIPRSGPARRRALQRIALATGIIDKIGAANYERMIRPSQYRWADWVGRCLIQGTGALAALAAEAWDGPLDQAQITAACAIRYVTLTDPALMPRGKYASLDALSDRLEARPEFKATYPADYAIPRSD